MTALRNSPTSPSVRPLACVIVSRRFGKSSNAVRIVTAAVVGTLVAVSAASCGGGSAASGSAAGASNTNSQASGPPPTASLGPASGEAVVRVGDQPITRDQVNHWMATLAGGDYHELSHGLGVPEGLVSDPPSFGRCVARLEAVVAAAPSKPSPPLTGVKLLTKCRQLYLALKAQATELLVTTELVFGLAAEEGVAVSEAEVLAAYRHSNAERFQTAAQLANDQAARRVSVSDELLLTKKNLLADKILTKLKSQSVGPTGLARAEASWSAKIDCHAGYVVEHCKQFHGAPPSSPDSPPATVLMEQVVALVTGHCSYPAACGKQ
jgi:hypothetical protein